jgi:hypothetical protein
MAEQAAQCATCVTLDVTAVRCVKQIDTTFVITRGTP